MIQRTQDIGNLKQQEDSKPMVQQHNIGIQQEKREDRLTHQVLHAEKKENAEIVKKYNVKAYPTYLYIKPDGTIFFKAVGKMNAENFINKSKQALNEMKSSKSISRWEKDPLATTYPTQTSSVPPSFWKGGGFTPALMR